MVEGHQVEKDGLIWTLTLRDRLRFHDKDPVLARDVVASSFVELWKSASHRPETTRLASTNGGSKGAGKAIPRATAEWPRRFDPGGLLAAA
jgi:ABC-type transport system substrate-binding protein